MTNNNFSNLDSAKLRQLCLRYERELSVAKDWMFWFLLVWTAAFLVMEWLNFVSGLEIPTAMEAGYTILLGAYILHKEAGRWAGIAMKLRKGELFVYIWWSVFLAMFLMEYFSRGAISMPENMPGIAYKVLGYFIFSEISKSANTWLTSHKKVNKI